MHQEPDVRFDPGSPGSHPGPKAGAKPLRHPGFPYSSCLKAAWNLLRIQINIDVSKVIVRKRILLCLSKYCVLESRKR